MYREQAHIFILIHSLSENLGVNFYFFIPLMYRPQKNTEILLSLMRLLQCIVYRTKLCRHLSN